MSWFGGSNANQPKPLNQTQWKRIPAAADQGGWQVRDEAIITEQRGVVWDLIKQLGKSITQGVSLTKIAIPVRIAEPRSYLELVTDGWCYAPIFLKQAAVEADPVERMKLVITFAIAGLSNTCTPKKPFNPILGETYQATFEDGTEIFCEQTSHHPPISNWELVGPGNMYTFYGSGELLASFRGNSIKGHQNGKHYIDFAMDGGRIEYHLPEVWVRGIMWGDRIIEYDGVVTFTDRKNNLTAEVRINPETGGWFSSKKFPTDYIEGMIFTPSAKNPEQKVVKSRIEGSWLGCIVFDGQQYWAYDQGAKFAAIPVEKPLPSDCRYREDLVHLKKGDLEGAQTWKQKLEEKQRRDAKLRKEAGTAAH